MAATIATLHNVSSCGKEFKTPEGTRFFLKSCENGELSIKASYGTITEFCNLVAGCFEPGSTFYGVTTIKMNFNGIKLFVSAEDANPEVIRKKWFDEYNKKQIAR